MANDDTERQTAAVASAVDRVLGPAVLGMYLYGSAMVGGLKPRSDLDFLVVTARSSWPRSDSVRARCEVPTQAPLSMRYQPRTW